MQGVFFKHIFKGYVSGDVSSESHSDSLLNCRPFILGNLCVCISHNTYADMEQRCLSNKKHGSRMLKPIIGPTYYCSLLNIVAVLSSILMVAHMWHLLKPGTIHTLLSLSCRRHNYTHQPQRKPLPHMSHEQNSIRDPHISTIQGSYERANRLDKRSF